MYIVLDRIEMLCLNKYRGCLIFYKVLWLSVGFLLDGCLSFLWVVFFKENRFFVVGVMGL